MALETATHISDLVATNPVGATDTKATLDDHIRLLKTVLKTDFPGISGPVTATHTQLNSVASSGGLYSTGTSTTSLAIGTGSKAFTTQASRGFAVGQSIKLTSDADVANYMIGTCSAYNSTTGAMSVTVTIVGGSGTLADWSITILPAVAASQSEMEAATSATAVATPSNVNWHPGVAKAWIKCNAAGAIAASHNITSITDDGTGLVTVTLATDFSSADYAIVATALKEVATVAVKTQAAGSFQLQASMPGVSSTFDPTAYYAVCFGDQA